MWKVKIEDIHGLNGEYEVEPDKYKQKHWRRLKKMADVTPLELGDRLIRGDITVLVALAAVELERAGKPFMEDMLWDSEAGQITFFDSEESDAGPPSMTPSGNGESERNVEQQQPSGDPTSSESAASPETSSQMISGTPV